MTWRILIVGVDHAIDGRVRLRHAESSSKQLAEWMTARLDGRLCEVRCLTAPACQQAHDALAWLAQAQHRLLVWTGHAERLGTGVHLITGDSSTASQVGRMLSLTSLQQCLAMSSEETTTAIVLDTCYSGALQPPRVLDDGATGATYLLASALPAALAVERGSEHGLAALLLQALDHCAGDAWRRSQREIALAELWQRLAAAPAASPTVEIRQQAHEGRPLPLAERQPDGRGRRLSSLEQALGFAIQAFRDYLDREVVRGVELIYFLSYDPWDGCLVYDGLVQGSIEQTLLDAIRGAFLDRDRQRSRFREKRGTSQLGPAGKCYERALDELAALKASKAKTPDVFIGSPMFMGDLNIDLYANSEFRAFDRLLGLTCCLYLPIVLHSDRDPDQPLGGVIMAASRLRWRLTPQVRGGDGEQRIAAARSEADPARADAGISEVIGRELGLPRGLGLDGHHKMDDFVRCIAGVYHQRRVSRGRIRQSVHPVAAKSVVRLLRNATSDLDARHRAIAEISDEVERGHGDLLAWLKELHEEGIGRYRSARDDLGSLAFATRRKLLRDYLAIDIWRELQLQLRNASPGKAEELKQYLVGQPLRFLYDQSPDAATVDAWVHRLALINDTTCERERNYRDPGDIRAFQRDAINDLLDAMRDGDGKIVDTLIGFLGHHAPVHKYARGIAAIHAVLDADAQHQLLEDLAHAVHVYLLGLWLMFTPDPHGHRIGDDAALRIAEFFRADERETRPDLVHLRARLDRGECPDTGLLRRSIPTASEVPADMIDELGLAWGFIAAMHDLGLPLQRFESWGRKFFERYFEHGAGSWPGPSGLAEIFLHPRFPVYKNAIVSLYRDRHVHDWLDAVFCRQLTGGIQHGFAGALLVANELEPDGSYASELGLPALWSRIPERLQAIYGTSDGGRAAHFERELVFPAYLAHAVALGHGEPAALADALAATPMASRQRRRYFEDMASYFRVDFAEFPLTWLLAVCNALAVPTSELEELGTRLRRAGGEPLIRFEPSTSHGSMGASPLFVRHVRATGDRALTLTLAPWRVYEDLTWRNGRTRRIPRAEIDALVAEWAQTVEDEPVDGLEEVTRWIVHGDTEYDTLYRHLPQLSDPPDVSTGGPHGEVKRTRLVWRASTEDHSVRVETTSRWWSPMSGELTDRGMTRRRKELHIRRSTFEIVYLLHALTKLDAVYVNTDWQLAIELVEVEAGASFTIGGRKIAPPAANSWNTTYEQAGPRLWPNETSLPPFVCDWLTSIGPTSVLDLGCGDGKNLKWLVEHGHRVIGVDGSPTALEQCLHHMAGRQPRAYELLPPMDVQALDRDSPLLRELPAAICIDVLGHQPDPERTLAELHRVLRTGGLAVVSVFHVDDDVRMVGAPMMQHLGAHDYYYHPQGDAARRQFFRFYRDGEPRALLERARFKVKRCEAHRWREPPHPGYRDHAHAHTSWFLLVEKVA